MRAIQSSKTLRLTAVQIVLVVVLVLGGGLIPTPIVSAPAVQTFGGDPLNAFPMLFPELLTLPAPTWVREGVRVTYYGQSASFAQNPDDEASAGAGYMHHDIVAVTDDAVVVSSSLYLDTGAGVTPSGVFGASFHPGYGDFWLNPAVLMDAEAVANDELAVVRMPATIADQEYEAVRFEYHIDEAVTVSMFDVETGLAVQVTELLAQD